MTQQDKELLLKDLCARLSYGVMFQCKYYDGPVKMNFIDTDYIGVEYRINGKFFLHELKPYLRTMSSMTEEERNEYFDFRNQELQRVAFAEVGKEAALAEISDWLNAHHFDYRGLIEKGLALEATEGMYK